MPRAPFAESPLTDSAANICRFELQSQDRRSSP